MKTVAGLLIFFILARLDTQAQVCTGSLGDPTVQIDFGSGAGPGAALPGIDNTMLLYTTSGCPREGEYAVRNSSFFCYDNAWATVPADHTPGDQNGYFLLVNGGNMGSFYKQTVNGLCPNTIYQVGSWVLNMMRFPNCGTSYRPNLQFKIETTSGQAIDSFTTGEILESISNNWVQENFTFRTPVGVGSVVLRIISLVGGGCGNDFAIDDISFSPCGPLVNASIIGYASQAPEVCESALANFTITANAPAGYSNPYYQWQVRDENNPKWVNIPGATSLQWQRPPTVAGTYEYRLAVADGILPGSAPCGVASNAVTVYVLRGPRAQATNYVDQCYGSDVLLQAAGGTSYHWSGPNGFSSNMQRPELHNIQFNDAGNYVVTVSFKGCSSNDTTRLVIYKAPKISVSFDEIAVCEGSPVQLNASGSTRYLWTPNKYLDNDTIANPVAKPLDTITYVVRAYSVFSCYDTAVVKLNVWKKPIANAGPDKRVKLGNGVLLAGKARGTDVNYYWSPATYLDNSQKLNPVSTPPQEMIYQLHVVSNRGCGSDIDEMKVKVFEKVIVPNTFTPNGDGINDTWEVRDLDVFSDALIEVYNTAGQQVFRSVGYDKAWDGTHQGRPLPVGTYYYVINLVGTKTKPMVGYVTILR